jgi:hypothetical protein
MRNEHGELFCAIQNKTAKMKPMPNTNTSSSVPFGSRIQDCFKSVHTPGKGEEKANKKINQAQSRTGRHCSTYTWFNKVYRHQIVFFLAVWPTPPVYSYPLSRLGKFYSGTSRPNIGKRCTRTYYPCLEKKSAGSLQRAHPKKVLSTDKRRVTQRKEE